MILFRPRMLVVMSIAAKHEEHQIPGKLPCMISLQRMTIPGRPLPGVRLLFRTRHSPFSEGRPDGHGPGESAGRSVADWSRPAKMTLGCRRPLPRFVWSLFSRGCTSTTSLMLVLLAARLGGPAGLGVVTVGFTAYLLVAGFLHALLSDPLVVSTAGAEPRARATATGAGFSIVLAVGLMATAAMTLVGTLIPKPLGGALLLFAPWMVPALVQEFWRTVMFRDGRVRAAAASDAVRVIGMAACLPLAWSMRAEWSVVASWGTGTACGAAAACVFGRISPAPLKQAWNWWATRAWPLGRWLAAESGVNSVGNQAAILLLTALIGPAGLGGLSAAQTVFAPLSMIVPAASLVALPAVAQLQKTRQASTAALAARWSAGLAVMSIVYVGIVGAMGQSVLSFAFGPAFGEYSALAVPIGAWQVMASCGFGFSLLLKTASRGRTLFCVEVLAQTSLFAFIAFGASRWGVSGAAWGIMASNGLTSLAYIAASLLGGRSVEGRPRNREFIPSVQALGKTTK